MSEKKPTGLELLRQPFPEHHISKLPKPTRKQTEEVKADFKKGIRCQICGAWHHPDVVHLDYVGHAALTDRLLDADPNWNWEPAATDESGLPVLDRDGGMWIKLTVCGVTRYGYGDAQGKTGGDAMKERIGDALRNAAMRFGAALDLWHKGVLHVEEQADPLAEAIERHRDTIDTIKQGIASGDLSGAAEAWFELNDEEKASIWAAPSKGGPFTTKEREVMKSPEFRQAHFGTEQGAA